MTGRKAEGLESTVWSQDLPDLWPRFQDPSVANPDGDPPAVCPLQQRYQVLAANPQPVANGSGDDLALLSYVVQNGGKLLERLASVVPVTLSRLDLPACRGQPQDCDQVALAGGMLQFGYRWGTQVGIEQDPNYTVYLRITPGNSGRESGQGNETVRPT